MRSTRVISSRLGQDLMLLLAMLALVVTALPVLAEPAPENQGEHPLPGSNSDIISNGTVKLGVHDEGHLNVYDPEAGRTIGLTYVPTGNESTAPGCTCEGWGAADAISGTTGHANDADGIYGIDFISFDSDGVNATSVVQIPNDDTPWLQVTHDFHPSHVTDYLYEVTVTIENLSDGPVDPRYRRVMDWDTEPTAFDEHVTVEAFGDVTNLLYSSNDGFASSNPLSTPTDLDFVGPPVGANFFDEGPDDHGALFDFGFDQLTAAGTDGDSVSFNIYYGAAGNETDALDAIGLVGAEVYSFGQTSTEFGPTEGTPNTFIFAFGQVGGASFVGRDGRPPLALTVTQDPLVLDAAGGSFELSARAFNLGDGDATGTVADLTIGSPLTLAAGDDPGAIGTVPAGELRSHEWTIEYPPGGCYGYETTVTVELDWAEREAEESPRIVDRLVRVAGECARVLGSVTEFGGGAIASAVVNACPSDGVGVCVTDTANSSGRYEFHLPGGDFDLEARPPATEPPLDLAPVTHLGVTVAGPEVEHDFVLGGPIPMPGDITLTPSSDSGEVASVFWGEPLTLTKVDQCPGATVRYEMRQGPDVNADGVPDEVVRSGGMGETEDAGGATSSYSTELASLYPLHDYANLYIYVDCPPHAGAEGSVFGDGDDHVQSFTIYIDPSGFVLDTNHDPIVGATVTLYRADHLLHGTTTAPPRDAFVQVPDQSAVMSMANRTNPDLTDDSGHFGWDTTSGWYLVRAEKDGCTSTTGAPFVETHMMFVPPEVTDLEIILNCGENPLNTGVGSPRPEARPTAANPLVVNLKSGPAISVVAQDQPAGPTDGWRFLPQALEIDGIASSTPRVIEFLVHSTILPAGRSLEALTVMRNGDVVPSCDSDDDADPCVVSRGDDNGTFSLTVHTTRTSLWTLAVPVSACPGGAEAGAFNDVPGGAHQAAVDCMASVGIIEGTGDGTFSPERSLTRGQLVLLLDRLNGSDGAGPRDHFDDDDGTVYEAAANRLAGLGIVGGTGDRTLAPGVEVSRGQAAALLLRLADHVGIEVPESAADAFSDDDGAVLEGEIDLAAALGLVAGYADGTYGPSEDIRRDQMASLLGRLTDRLVVIERWSPPGV